ncbi:MAG: helix-turn-helix transcriptional regulator [Gammaproteobacteria bacterium]|nr:helix-turn-helix transcriptional regulator [Gammaproteobacteria bacterium]
MVKHNEAVLDNTFSALADPIRRGILAQLIRGEASVMKLAEPFDASLPAISRLLRVLERAGLLVQEKDGRVRRCQLVAEPLKDAAEWIAGYRRFWEHQFDALAAYLNAPCEEKIWPTKNHNKRSRSASSAPSRPRANRSSKRGPTRKS